MAALEDYSFSGSLKVCEEILRWFYGTGSLIQGLLTLGQVNPLLKGPKDSPVYHVFILSFSLSGPQAVALCQFKQPGYLQVSPGGQHGFQLKAPASQFIWLSSLLS